MPKPTETNNVVVTHGLAVLNHEDSADTLKQEYESLLNHYTKLDNRLEKIVTQSDRQYRQIINLNSRLKKEIEERKNAEEKLLIMATKDVLTGLNNRRHFLQIADREFKNSLRHHQDLSVLMIDIDFFKKVNDTYGHKVGDDVIIFVTRLISKNIRETDILGRLGGEEFAVLLPQTATKDACRVAEKIRHSVESTVYFENKTIHITLSIGISSLEKCSADFSELLDQSDKALYLSKETGRNKITEYECP